MLTCPFHWLTGLNCPLCGAQRLLMALLHGQVGEAFWFNPALFVAMPLAAAWWVWRRELTSRTALFLLVGVFAWGVTRNILHI